MELTLQDGICDNLQALSMPDEDCHIDGRINDNDDRIRARLKS
jgi:hypothetical protein